MTLEKYLKDGKLTSKGKDLGAEFIRCMCDMGPCSHCMLQKEGYGHFLGTDLCPAKGKLQTRDDVNQVLNVYKQSLKGTYINP